MENNNLTTLFDKYYKGHSTNMSSTAMKFFSNTLVLNNIKILTGPNLASDFIKSKEFNKMSMEQKMEYIQVMLNTACDDLGIPYIELQVRKRSLWQKLIDSGMAEESFDACVIYDSTNLKTIVETIAHEAFHQYIKLVRKGIVPINSIYAGAVYSESNNENNRKAYISDFEEYCARWFGVEFAEKYGHPTNKERWIALENKYSPNIKEQFQLACEQILESGKYQMLEKKEDIPTSDEFKL